MQRSRLLELSLDELDQLSFEDSWTLGDFITSACLLEAAAPKAGNVHPTASFDDMNYEDFRQSARTIGSVFDHTDNEGVGRLILEAVQATRKEIGKNTNLGIILLMVPLAVSLKQNSSNNKRDFLEGWKDALAATLKSLTEDDSIAVYEAIAIAKPGGIRRVSEMDIQEKPPARLLDAMQLAAKWDDIAKQYATNFSDIFDLSLQLDECRKHLRQGWFDALVSIQVDRLASHGDSLIARKNAPATVEQVQHLANSVVQNPALTRHLAWQQLDNYLRFDGHRRNPGTTADMLAAATFVSLLVEYNTR